jgi:hypothetical protein
VIYTIKSDCVNDCEDEYTILYRKEHDSVVKSFEAKSIDPDQNSVNRGTIFWDIETRIKGNKHFCLIGEDKTLKDGTQIKATKSYYIEAVILHAVYKPHKGKTQYISFTTDRDTNCCRNFIDW